MTETRPQPPLPPKTPATLLAASLLTASLLTAAPLPAAEPTPKTPPDAPPDARPNIVLVTSDDHRWDALGAAGNAAIHTPVLDRLAREGVYFTQATVNVSQCLPVRASLVREGRRPGHLRPLMLMGIDSVGVGGEAGQLPPTLLAFTGLETPARWPGRNLLPLLEKAGAAGFGDAYSEWADDRGRRFGHLAHRLVRTPTHKLIVWEDPAQPPELYDLEADPREAHNLAGEPKAAAVETDLLRRLLAWMGKTEDPARSWEHLVKLAEAHGLAVP
jgi:arylsulfatase A-like enzyme